MNSTLSEKRTAMAAMGKLDTEASSKKQKTKQETLPEVRTEVLREVSKTMDVTFGPKENPFVASMQEVREQTIERPLHSRYPETKFQPTFHYELFWDPTEEEFKRFEQESAKIQTVNEEERAAVRRKEYLRCYDDAVRCDEMSPFTVNEYHDEHGYDSDGDDPTYVYVEKHDYRFFGKVHGRHNIGYLARPNQREDEDDDDYKERLMKLDPWNELADFDEDDVIEKVIKGRTGLLESMANAVESQWFKTNGWHTSSIGGRGSGQVTMYLPAEIVKCKYIDEEVEMLTTMLEEDYCDGGIFGTGIDDFDKDINEDPTLKPCNLGEEVVNTDGEDIAPREWCNIMIATHWIFE